jgi:response regulator RpfG family c-di-GMP phosphodiesterase
LKVLYVEDNEEIQEIYGTLIKNTFQCEVILSSAEDEAIGHIEKDPEIKVVITDIYLESGNGINIYKYLESKLLLGKITFVFLSGYPKEDALAGIPNFEQASEMNVFLEKPVKKATFNELLRYIPVQAKKDETFQDYFPVSLNMLRFLNVLPVNLFVCLSGSNFVKIFNEGDTLKKSRNEYRLEKYEGKLCIQKEDFDKFSEYFLKVAEKIFEAAKRKKTTKGMLADEMDIHSILHRKILHSGISPQLAETCKSFAIHSIDEIKKVESLKMLLDKLINKGPFLFEHSMLTLYFTSIMLNELKWVSNTSQFKLAIVCLFHDISLPDDEDYSELEILNLKPNIIKSKYPKYFSHPVNSAIILDQIKGLPADTTAIVLQHHELPDGSGFPYGLNGNEIFPLSCLFNACHHLVAHLFMKNFAPGAVKEALQALRPVYSVGHSKKVIEEMIRVFAPELIAKVS